ncbi:macro domain-containing protein [Kitasatospora sp. NPDC001175]|uniref:macro domain-containing protein n=1 Tax=Kitasatospora sp. NPDC001175 TaxID=3157103 RepID=UPI003D04B18F
MPQTDLPDHVSVLREVREVRRAGLVRLRELELPSLTSAASAVEPSAGPEYRAASVERLLRLALAGIDSGTLRSAAEYSLGLAQGTRDWPPADRRKRAAGVYGVSVERFRKHHEVMVLGELAEQVVRLSAQAAVESAPVTDQPSAVPLTGGHRELRVRVGGRTVAVTLHVHPVDLLRDVDVVVSPTNTYLALPEPYKSSVSASLRRAGALRGPTGELVEDLVHDELRRWTARYGAPGRAVLPGAVAAVGSGALAEQGIRRIYHAAVAVPRPGTNDYDVLPADVTRAVARVFTLLAEERARFDPPLRSVCLPLLGSGRGGLRHEASIAALWAAVDAELARGADWEVHLVVRRTAVADLVERLLTGADPAAPAASAASVGPVGRMR